jgi:hypothetical protein
MSSRPFNLALRFLLEIAASLALAYWGWRQASGAVRYVPAIALPLAAAALWGTFRVPGDSSASGAAPVPVPGPARLLLELALFGFAVWGLLSEGAATPSLILGGALLLHYGLSYDRVLWLLRQ